MSDSSSSPEVAIVGIGCRFPPDSTGADGYWDALCAGTDAVGPIPSDRWTREAFFDPDPTRPGKMNVTRGAFLTQPIDAFDAAFFGIAPVEAEQIDPQQRLLLEVAWEALEDTGTNVTSLRGTPVGVFIGAFTMDNMLERAGASAREDIRAQTAMTCTHTVLASRLSYTFDLRGPCMTLDTACSASLVAVHQACRSLADGDCDLAVAGGVSRIFRPETYIMMTKGGFLAPDGRSKSFSRNGDGYGRGEGCGVVVLKRLADAERDGDRVYAVIERSGVNQDGRTGGMAMPSPDAQARLMVSVLRRAGVDPAAVDFVEAHGTGTAVGDPVEMSSIGNVYGRAKGRSSPCIVGSVKAGIGHTEGAAGVAGLIKAALVAYHGIVPPQAWLDDLNPTIDFSSLGISVATRKVPIRHQPGPRRVAVNSFGYGGTNAHALLRSHPATRGAPPRQGVLGPALSLAIVSGHTQDAAEAVAQSYARALDGVETEGARARILASAASRAAHTHRMVARAPDDRLVEVLDRAGRGDLPPEVEMGRAPSSAPVRAAFVFSGMGPQWWGMGQELFRRSTIFRDHLLRCDDLYREVAGQSILDEMMKGEADSRISRTAVAQPANVALQTGLVAVLEAVGVRPAACLGHSVGEISAGYAAGALSLADALRIAFHRARLQATTAGTGSMLATSMTEEQAAAITDEFSDIAIAAVNGPDATTLSGDATALDQIERRLASEGRFARALQVEVPYHSPAMDPILPRLRQALDAVTSNPAAVPLYSSVGEEHDTGEWDAEYWMRNVREPVRFHRAAQRMVDDGHRVLVELGPHPVLSLYLTALASTGAPTIVTSALHRSRGEVDSLVAMLGHLWVNGVDIDWTALLGDPRPGSIPSYPWQRQRFWQESDLVHRERTGETDRGDDLAGVPVSSHPETRDVELGPSRVPWVGDHVVGNAPVFPAAGFLEVVTSTARARSGGHLPIQIEALEISSPLVIPSRADAVLRVTHLDDGSVVMGARARGTDRWRPHATARARTLNVAPPPRADETKRVGREVPVNALYDTFRHLGLDYQGPFRCIVDVVASPHSVLTAVELPDTPDPDRWTLYPPGVDAVFQSLLALGPLEEAQVFLPVRIDSVVVHDQIPRCFMASARLRYRSAQGVVVDAEITDHDGGTLVEMRGIEMQRSWLPTETDERLDAISYETAWAVVPESPRRRPAGTWHLLFDPEPHLERALRQATEDPHSIQVHRDGRCPEVAGPGHALVVRVDPTNASDIVNEVQTLVQTIANLPDDDPIEMVLLTTAAIAADQRDSVAGWLGAWAVGCRRAISNEVAHVRVRHVDVDDPSNAMVAQAILHHDGDEIAVRGDSLLAPTIRSASAASHDRRWGEIAPVRRASEMANYGLSPATSAEDQLRWVGLPRRPPEPGEVELRVEALGLNYKDALKASGVFPLRMAARTFGGAEIGSEQSVVIERVGRGVDDVRVGDRFLASIPGGCARYLTVPRSDVRLIPHPDRWSPSQGAGQLVAAATAHRAIVELAGLQPDETLLVHGGAGALGLACIDIGRAAGARVIATASTPSRRDVAMQRGAETCFDSRSFDFVGQVLEVTGGRGADVTLNTLPGADGLAANIAATAPGGRLVEIGKRAIGAGETLPLDLLDRNITLIAFDLDHYVRDSTEFERLATTVLDEFAQGRYQPIPVTEIPPRSVNDAFRSLLRSSHVGKLAIDLGQSDQLECFEPPRRSPCVRPDASYLISGGTGGVGIEVAQWLAASGATRLGLISRRGRLQGHAEEVVEHLRARGVEVEVASVDITREGDLGAFLAAWRSPARPLRGVVHAAGVAHDVPFAALDRSDTEAVLAPKITGAEELHRATTDDPLELFLLTSSVSSWTGTSGQAAYAAANSALEAFAHWRRQQGRPACCMALGPVADVGMAALTEEVAAYVTLLGFTPIPVDDIPLVLQRVVAWNYPAIGVFGIDWLRWSYAEPRAAGEVRFRSLISDARASTTGSDAAAGSRLRAMGRAEREAAVCNLLIVELASVLGMERDDIDPESPLVGLGLDSLMVVEVQTRLNRSLGTNLSVMGLMAQTSVRGLADEISSQMAS